MTWIIIILLIVIVIIFIFRSLSSEDKRIKVFLKIYKTAKHKYSDLDEKEILGIVMEEHILPGKSIKLGKTSMKGTKYIDGVFEDKDVNINDIIYHAITAEFPKKYRPYNIDLEQMRKNNRGQAVDVKQKLKDKIKLLSESINM